MKKGYKVILMSLIFIAVSCFVFWMFKANEKNASNINETMVTDNSGNESEPPKVSENKLILKADDGKVNKIDIATGVIEEITAPDESDPLESSSLLSQKYQGLDPNLQKENGLMRWLKFDAKKNILYGVVDGGWSLVYACDTQSRKCENTAVGDATSGMNHVIVPDGSFSPSLEKFVMVNQHDTENIETGKSWELLLYASADLTKPLKTFDISVIIDRDENVVYDSVQSVAWSGDEKKLAIGTARRIFMFDLESGKISLAYVAPIDEEGAFYWDGSSLFLSSDAKFIAFIDEDALESVLNSTDEDDTAINVLKKIDLENFNKVSEIFRGFDLSY